MSSPFDAYSLSDIDVAVLRAVADACNYSLSAHVPEPAILKRCDKSVIKDIGKSLKKLHSKGLVIRHPTRGNMTYQLSQDGLMLAQML